MMNRVLKTILRISFFLSCCTLCFDSAAQCTPACNDGIRFSLDPGQSTTVGIDILLEGPRCVDPSYSFSTTPFDTTITLSGNTPGPRDFKITELNSGNACWGTLSVINTNCINDNEPPTFPNLPPTTIHIRCDEQVPTAPNLLANDNCDQDVTVEVKDVIISSGNCFGKEILTRTWKAIDDNLNSTSISQSIIISSGQINTIKIPEDTEGTCTEPFDPILLYFDNNPCDLMALNYADTKVNGGSECGKIVREYTLLDWCNTSAGGEEWNIPSLDIDMDGKNDAFDLIIDNENKTVSLSDGTELRNTLPSIYRYTQIINIPDCSEPIAICRDLNVSIFPNQNEIVWAADLNSGSFDDCRFDDLDLRINWADSSNQTTPPTITFLQIDASFAGTHTVELWAGDVDGNWDFCTTNLNITIRPQNGHVISGYVFSDTENDCNFDPNQETALKNWLVNVIAQPSGMVYSNTTDPSGYFYLSLPLDGDLEYEVSLISNVNYSQTCQSVYNLTADDPNTPQLFDLDVPVVLEGDCPLMAVDISTPLLRRCFDGIYYVNYCNYGAVTAKDAFVEVDLDDYIIFQSSNLAETNVQGNLYSFEIGDVQPGECGRFFINIEVSCDAALGVTHCSEAHIFPDSLCQKSTQWSGASIEIEAVCNADSVRFTIKNVGDQAMVTDLNYIIIEDVLMYRMGSFNLGPAETFPLDAMPASGSTWTIRTDQEAFHPLANVPSLSVEGCLEMGGTTFTTGVTPQFNQSNGNGFSNIDCTQNRGSFDPNDKQGFPLGYGSSFQIEENTDIEYKIRFQNTGTDTAFTVRVEDKISQHLDLESIIPGAASHDYSFQIREDSTVVFLFENVMLPDSNINELASHGFVNFKISQKTDLQRGTVIPNTANIYFDFNAPVITNEVYHTVGLDIVTVSINDLAADLGLKIYPNPFHTQATFELKKINNEPWVIRIFDLTGRTISTQSTNYSQLTINKKDLKAGIYFFEITTESKGSCGGKIIVSE